MTISTNVIYVEGVGFKNDDGVVVYEEAYVSPFDQFHCDHVYVVYGKTGDHKLYLEDEYKTQVKQADVEFAFRRNALIIFDGTNYFVPVSMAANKVSTVGGSTTAATLVEWTAEATA